MKDDLAPVILFVYDRLEETKRTISALKSNYLSKYSHLYVFSDAPKRHASKDKVIKVREYVNNLDGFKSVTVIHRESNYGLAKSVIEGVTSVISNHGKVIVLEDDLITSQNFLTYMNMSLNFYKNSGVVYSISGYTPPIDGIRDYEFDSYFSYRSYSWGWATWSDRWSVIDWKIKDFSQFNNNSKSQKLFNKGGQDLTRMLRKQKSGKLDSWAIRWCYNQFLQQKLTLCPMSSKVVNIGFNKNGTHTVKQKEYKDVLDVKDKTNFNFPVNIEIQPDILKQSLWYNTNMFKIIKLLQRVLKI